MGTTMQAEFTREILPILTSDALFSYARSLAQCDEDAEDLIQNTGLKLLAAFESYTATSERSTRAWVRRSLFNTFVHGWRHERVVQRAEEHRAHQFPVPSQPPLPDDSGLSSQVTDAIARLPPEYRATLEATLLRGLSYKEAAVAIGCPLGTVMSRTYRARKILRAELAEYAAAEYGYGICA